MSDALPAPGPSRRRGGSAVPRVLWTPRTYLLVGFGGSLLALTVALGNPDPLFAAVPLLLAPLFATFQFPPGLASVDLSWDLGGVGSEVTIVGTLKGDFAGSHGYVSVRLVPPPGLTEVEPMRVVTGAETMRFSARWRLAEPSIVSVPPPLVLWEDPLGLTERTLGGDRPPLQIERYPTWGRRFVTLQLERTSAQLGATRSRLVGTSGEFFGLRRAGPDEPPRRINWRATARAGRLIANDYQVERTGDLVVVLDLRPTELRYELDERLLGLARAAARGLAESFFHNKVRFGLATFGEWVEAVPLSTGRAHRLRVFRAIAAARRAKVVGVAERCAVGLARFYPRGTTMLVVSHWKGEPDLNLVPSLRRQGFPVVLLSPSPLPLRAGTGGLEPADEPLAAHLERLERRAQLADLWVHGPVVDWSDYWSLEPLVRVLRRPPLRRSA